MELQPDHSPAEIACKEEPKQDPQSLEDTEMQPMADNAVKALRRLEELRSELGNDPELQKALENTEQPSVEFLRGAMELYRLAQTALAQQLRSKVERIKEVRKLRVKARRMSIKVTKILGC